MLDFSHDGGRIVNFTCAWIVRKWGHFLYPGDIRRLQSRLQEFVRAASRKVGLPDGTVIECFASVDGTNMEVCRPSGPWEIQNAIFDGHHWIWAFVYMGVTTPDGIQSIFWGPEAGCENDENVVCKAALHRIIEDNFTVQLPNGATIKYYVYADGGYALSDDRIVRGFPDAMAGSDERLHNRIMNKVRISAEWGFQRIKTIFKSLMYRYCHSPFQGAVSVRFLAATILTNCHTCLYGAQENSYFGVPSPDLMEYLKPRDAVFEQMMDRYPSPPWASLYRGTDEAFIRARHG